MMSKTDFRVVHLFPFSARLSGGHTNAIIAFMESQLQYGIDIRGLSPLGKNIPPEQSRRIEHLPIREMDFDAANFCATAMDSVTGCQHPVFHFTGITRPFVQLARSLEKAAIPYVFSSQGQLHYRGMIHWLKKFMYLNFAIPFVRNAGGLHFTTRRESTRCKYLLPLWRGPVLVHHNVVRVPDPGTVRPMSREQHGIPAEAFVFAYLGRLHIEHKGLDLLVKAFAKAFAGSNFYLVLIGPDWAGGRQFLERLAQRLNCGGRVRFLGPQFGDGKWGALKMADAFVSPSRWDACPSAVTEAIGFGVPTIVSSTMNPAPDFAEGRAAIACKPSPDALARAMRELAKDSQLQQSLSDCGRKWVLKNCSLETAGARLADFYRQVLQGR